MQPCLLIDGSNLLYRVFWIHTQTPMVNSIGENVAVYSLFLKSIKQLFDKYNAKSCFVCWDTKQLWPSTNFRTDNQTYKENRNHDLFQGIKECEQTLIDVLQNLGIKNMSPYRMEGDDVISWLSHTINGKKVIVSADKDLWQLIDLNTVIYNPQSKKEINVSSFNEYLDIPLSKYVLYKSIIGDKSDNIEGIPRYGPVKATKIVNNWEIEAKKLTPNQQVLLEKNQKLMDLRRGYLEYPEEVGWYQTQYNTACVCNFSKFQSFCREKEIHSIVNYIEDWKSTFNREQDITSIVNLIEKLGLNA